MLIVLRYFEKRVSLSMVTNCGTWTCLKLKSSFCPSDVQLLSFFWLPTELSVPISSFGRQGPELRGPLFTSNFTLCALPSSSQPVSLWPTCRVSKPHALSCPWPLAVGSFSYADVSLHLCLNTPSNRGPGSVPTCFLPNTSHIIYFSKVWLHVLLALLYVHTWGRRD